MAPSRVLVPLDGSPLASRALRHALETYDCEVTVLNVLTPIGSGMSEGGIREHTEGRVADAEDKAEKLVAEAREAVGAPDQHVETVIETGDPADVIVSHVEGRDVDHVVMGGHGGEDSGLVSRLLGTVATVVVSEAPASVTVVR